jgi:hypothetical protein
MKIVALSGEKPFCSDEAVEVEFSSAKVGTVLAL